MHKTLKALSLWLVLLPAAAITWFIVWLDRKLKFKLPFPRDVQELAARKDWLVNELKKNKVIPTEAVVISYEVKELNPELIFRSNAGIIYLKHTADNIEHSLKCFAKFAPIMGTVWNRAIFNLQLNHIKEAEFNNYFVSADKALPAPKVYTAQVEPVSGNLCLVTEFMDGCREYEVHQDFPQEHLDLALEGMAQLHALYWNNQDERMKKVHPIEDKVVYFMDSVVAGSWSTAARKILVQSWLLMNEEQTVLHGDSRIGNMMFPAGPNGRYVLIDWQAVRKGKALYDIAYFLVLSLPTEHLQRVEEQSLKTYYNYLLAKGVTGYSYKQLQDDYKHACLCVLVLLSLPLLSGESSIEGEAVKIFSWGMNIWRERMQQYFKTFDYTWVSKEYGITETEASNAVAEMLKVIDDRLRGMKGTYVK